MNFAAFLVELQIRAGGPADVRDPLEAAAAYLAERSNLEEARALRLVIGALLAGHADFDEADLSVFTPEGAQLAAALVDARLRGLCSTSDWRSADSWSMTTMGRIFCRRNDIQCSHHRQVHARSERLGNLSQGTRALRQGSAPGRLRGRQ